MRWKSSRSLSLSLLCNNLFFSSTSTVAPLEVGNSEKESESELALVSLPFFVPLSCVVTFPPPLPLSSNAINLTWRNNISSSSAGRAASERNYDSGMNHLKKSAHDIALPERKMTEAIMNLIIGP